LVHEVYLRLAGNTEPDFGNRAHLMGVAARVMRQVLVDHARLRAAKKRSGGMRVPLEEGLSFAGSRAAMVVSLDHALLDLERQDPEQARILELKYFGGMTAEDTADLLGVTVHVVNRRMRMARAWLRRQMNAHDQR
jgi:RNA polymerase sigma factor (TIGR02999 family)